MDLLNRARLEVTEVEKAIKSLQSKLVDLQAFIASGERLFGASQHLGESVMPQAEGGAASSLASPRRASQPGSDGRVTKKQRVTELAASALADGAHIPAKELADLVVANGIDLGGDPIGYLSALLSRDDRFKSERAKGGWAMNSGPNNEEAPSGVSAPAGPDLLDLQLASVTAGTGPTPD